MQDVSSIHIPQVDVGAHLIANYLNELEIAVVSGEMQRCELLISHLVGPDL